MHAHLIVTQNHEPRAQIQKLAERLHAKIMDFPLRKIDDVRNLNNLVRLSFEEPTLIVSENINEAGEEALNAFLKNLEEPQENVYFALTSPSLKKVLPTIASRCEIILTTGRGEDKENYEEIEKFFEMSEGEKLNYIDKIKDRSKAIEWAENTVNFLHSQLHKNKLEYSVVADNLEQALKTYSGLNANGNVNLHLVNFVIHLTNS